MNTRWNVLEYLRDEDEIADFLEGAIEEGDGDAAYYLRCLSKVAQARLINQITMETGIDRKLLCDVLQAEWDGRNGEAIHEKAVAILEVGRAFAMPLEAVPAHA